MGYNYNAEFLLGMLKNENSFTMILDIDKVFSKEDVNILSQAEGVEEINVTEEE